MLRVHQWLKNGLIAVPTGAVARIFQRIDAHRRMPAGLRVLQRRRVGDLHRQRLLSTWRSTAGIRPSATGRLASGIVSMRIRHDRRSLILLPIQRLPSLCFLPIEFFGVRCCGLPGGHHRLLVLGQAHAFARRAMMLAGLYTMRVLAGAAATGIEAIVLAAGLLESSSSSRWRW
jgi:hypothetical protein